MLLCKTDEKNVNSSFRFFLNLFNVELFYICSWRETSGKTALMTSFLKIQLTKSGFKWALNPQIRDKRVTGIDYQLKHFPHVLLCTNTVHDPGKHLYSGIFKDPLDTKHKSSKKDWIHKCYVSCLKLEYFFKSCKTQSLNAYNVQQVAVGWHSKNLGLRSPPCERRYAVCVVCAPD